MGVCSHTVASGLEPTCPGFFIRATSSFRNGGTGAFRSGNGANATRTSPRVDRVSSATRSAHTLRTEWLCIEQAGIFPCARAVSGSDALSLRDWYTSAGTGRLLPGRLKGTMSASGSTASIRKKSPRRSKVAAGRHYASLLKSRAISRRPIASTCSETGWRSSPVVTTKERSGPTSLQAN